MRVYGKGKRQRLSRDYIAMIDMFWEQGRQQEVYDFVFEEGNPVAHRQHKMLDEWIRNDPKGQVHHDKRMQDVMDSIPNFLSDYEEETKEEKKREKEEIKTHFIGCMCRKCYDYCRTPAEIFYMNKNERRNWRYANDPAYKMDKLLSQAIKKYIKRNGMRKFKKKWTNLVDWTIEEFMSHMETKFSDGMSWNNHGKWHIDHIKAKSRFVFSYPGCPEFRKCWALENLQPLWRADNLRKSNKIQ